MTETQRWAYSTYTGRSVTVPNFHHIEEVDPVLRKIVLLQGATEFIEMDLRDVECRLLAHEAANTNK